MRKISRAKRKSGGKPAQAVVTWLLCMLAACILIKAVAGSELGKKVLDQFDEYLPHFKKLIPNEYKKMITLSAKLEEKGLNSEQAQMEAFYESIGAKH